MKNIWRYILNTPFNIYKDADEAAVAARKAGYTMFTWNDEIYATPAEKEAWNAHKLFSVEQLEA